MNKIELIKEDYNVGDPIRIECSLGIKEGYIIDFKQDRLKIRPFEEGRKPISIAEENIGDFEEALPPSKTSKTSCCSSENSMLISSIQKHIEDDSLESTGKIEVCSNVDKCGDNSLLGNQNMPLGTNDNVQRSVEGRQNTANIACIIHRASSA